MPQMRRSYASLEAISLLKEQLKEDVAVYLLYTDKAYFPEHSTLTPDPNIIIVENAAPFLRELKSLSPRIFFVDKDSGIKYFMDLPRIRAGSREKQIRRHLALFKPVKSPRLINHHHRQYYNN